MFFFACCVFREKSSRTYTIALHFSRRLFFILFLRIKKKPIRNLFCIFISSNRNRLLETAYLLTYQHSNTFLSFKKPPKCDVSPLLLNSMTFLIISFTSSPDW